MGGAERLDRVGEGAERLSARAAALWGGADYDAIVPYFAPVYDELVEVLAPRAGERMLDVATGSGEIALRAARRGADVTGIDIAPALLDLARAKPDADRARFEVGDARALPFADGSFDVVASNFGVIFAPDREAAAGELARVCRGGGRLALTAWWRGSTIGELLRPFGRTSSIDVEAWSEQAELERLLGDAFELELRERVWEFESESGEAAFDFLVRTAPPMKAFFDSLEAERRAEARAALVTYWEGFRDGDRVREPRRYVLVLGRRR